MGNGKLRGVLAESYFWSKFHEVTLGNFSYDPTGWSRLFQIQLLHKPCVSAF